MEEKLTSFKFVPYKTIIDYSIPDNSTGEEEICSIFKTEDDEIR